jgi:photosystem II stability/assembly factor-like uncharacterized protein
MVIVVLRIVAALALIAACGPVAAAPTANAPSSAPPLSTTDHNGGINGTPSEAAARTATPSMTAAVLETTHVAAAGNGAIWAIAAGSRLFRSFDRGETWEQRALPPPSSFAAIAFINGREGWILTVGSAASLCQGQQTALYRTTDGAGSWRLIPTRGISDAQCKGALVFNDATHGYLSAGDEFTPPRVYATADGGTTWSASQPFPDPPGFTTTALGNALHAGPVADFGNELFANASSYVVDRMVNYVFRSIDRGATWSYASRAPDGVPVVFITPTRWIELASGDLSRETTNAGRSWHLLATDYTQAAPIPAQVVFGDADTGYAVVRGSLRRTLDGGAHWTGLKTPGT